MRDRYTDTDVCYPVLVAAFPHLELNEIPTTDQRLTLDLIGLPDALASVVQNIVCARYFSVSNSDLALIQSALSLWNYIIVDGSIQLSASVPTSASLPENIADEWLSLHISVLNLSTSRRKVGTDKFIVPKRPKGSKTKARDLHDILYSSGAFFTGHFIDDCFHHIVVPFDSISKLTPARALDNGYLLRSTFFSKNRTGYEVTLAHWDSSDWIHLEDASNPVDAAKIWLRLKEKQDLKFDRDALRMILLDAPCTPNPKQPTPKSVNHHCLCIICNKIIINFRELRGHIFNQHTRSFIPHCTVLKDDGQICGHKFFLQADVYYHKQIHKLHEGPASRSGGPRTSKLILGNNIPPNYFPMHHTWLKTVAGEVLPLDPPPK